MVLKYFVQVHQDHPIIVVHFLFVINQYLKSVLTMFELFLPTEISMLFALIVFSSPPKRSPLVTPGRQRSDPSSRHPSPTPPSFLPCLQPQARPPPRVSHSGLGTVEAPRLSPTLPLALASLGEPVESGSQPHGHSPFRYLRQLPL